MIILTASKDKQLKYLYYFFVWHPFKEMPGSQNQDSEIARAHRNPSVGNFM